MKYPVLPRESLPLGGAILVSGLLVLSGCSSSSSNPADLQAQAVDGYIVNGTVECDGTENGTTGLAGVMVCPPDTKLFAVSGGIDVGFDELEDQNGELFLGKMTAPTSLDYVTPTSTLLVELSKDEEGDFDLSEFDNAKATLETALGMEIDLEADATSDLETVKLNAQIQSVISSFVDSSDDYPTVLSAFASNITNAANTTETINLVSGVDDLIAGVNNSLITLDQDIAKDSSELDAIIAQVAATNFEISRAQGTSGIDQAAKQPASSGQVMTIDRNTVAVNLGIASGQFNMFGLADFESDKKGADGTYTVSASNLTESIGFGRTALTVNSTLANQPIELGFDLDSTNTGDSRKLSVATTALLSMSEGDNASIEVNVPAGTLLSVTAVDEDGTRTDASFTVSDERTFSSDNGFVSINLTDIEKRLTDKDITGFLDRVGNYQVTLVVGGIRVAQTVENVKVLLSPYTVVTDGMTVNGTGFRGYTSFVSADQ